MLRKPCRISRISITDCRRPLRYCNPYRMTRRRYALKCQNSVPLWNNYERKKQMDDTPEAQNPSAPNPNPSTPPNTPAPDTPKAVSNDDWREQVENRLTEIERRLGI